jgi:hypothetical protein
MKMPTGKNKNLAIGGAVVGGLVIMWYVRKRSAANTASATTTSSSGYDPNAIDPNTGLPYGQEAGIDPGTGLTYQAESGFGYGYSGSAVNAGGAATSGTGGTVYTSNTQWMGDAQQDAQNYFGASYSLTTSALGKYISQSSQGLNPDEYAVVSEVVAQIGQPPVGQPYRLIHATPAPPSGGEGSGGGGSTPPPPPPPPNNGIPAGYHMQDPQVATLVVGISLHQYWVWHPYMSYEKLQRLNPGLSPTDTHHGGKNIYIRTSDAHLVPDS